MHRWERLRDVYVELWPSPSEIRIDEHTHNTYVAGLEGFYNSLDELYQDLIKNEIPADWNTYVGIQDGMPVLRADPPVIVDFIIPVTAWLGTSGVAIAVYKILDLWVKK